MCFKSLHPYWVKATRCFYLKKEKNGEQQGAGQKKVYTSVWFSMGTFSDSTQISAGKAECHSCLPWIARRNSHKGWSDSESKIAFQNISSSVHVYES